MRERVPLYKLLEGSKIPKDSILSELKASHNNQWRSKWEQSIGYSKEDILDAIDARDAKTLRRISRRACSLSSGVYSRIIWYMALLPTYDCVIDPYIKSGEPMINYKEEIQNIMNKALDFVDNLRIHNMASYLAYDVLVDGVSYKLKRETDKGLVLQNLPIDYCRTRYQINNKDIIEFNVKYFDTIYDETEKFNVLQSLPSEFKKEYNRYKSNKLPLDIHDRGAWFAVPAELGEVFYLTRDLLPFFIKVLPDILDWEAIKDINLVKAEQELSKVLVQQFETTKSGQMHLDLPEITQMHDNALDMVGDIEGLDVLTTFANVHIEDMQQKSGFNQTNDPLKNFLNSIFANAGVSNNLFATDGNLALDKSISNDEAIMFMLFVDKIENFLNYELKKRFETDEIGLICNFPRITIYNFKDMADLFKGQAMYGYSKRLPAIATGQTQSSLMAAIEYENNVMGMADIMKPLQSSATQSPKANNNNNNGNESNGEANPEGRPELPDDQKSDKTLKNLASIG